jgi:hypothetical protein
VIDGFRRVWRRTVGDGDDFSAQADEHLADFDCIGSQLTPETLGKDSIVERLLELVFQFARRLDAVVEEPREVLL